MLGFEDLRSYLQARCDAGDSGPRIATELGVGDRQVQAALARSGCGWRRARSGWQPSGAATPSSASPPAWPSWASPRCGPTWSTGSWSGHGCWPRLAAELAAHRLTVRRLLERHGSRQRAGSVR